MRIKLYLALTMIFLIASIYNTFQIFQRGILNNSAKNLVDYLVGIMGFVAYLWLYNHYKNKEA